MTAIEQPQLNTLGGKFFGYIPDFSSMEQMTPEDRADIRAQLVIDTFSPGAVVKLEELAQQEDRAEQLTGAFDPHGDGRLFGGQDDPKRIQDTIIRGIYRLPSEEQDLLEASLGAAGEVGPEADTAQNTIARHMAGMAIERARTANYINARLALAAVAAVAAYQSGNDVRQAS